MRIYRSAIAMCAIGALMLFAATSASAKDLKVDDDGAQCPNATFNTITAAVAAASPGDKIQVCAGTYAEQVHIQNLDDLKLEGKGNPTIKAPPVQNSPRAIVHIDSSDGVSLKGFVVSGPWGEPGCNTDRHYGVFVDNSFDAKITENHVTLIRDTIPALWGCQDGIGIQVGRQAVSSTGSAKIEHNLIDLYQKGGIGVDNVGSDADINHNEVVGDPGPTGAGVITAQNGVQISRGAGSKVKENEIYNNRYTAGPDSAEGILLFQAGAGLVDIDHNDVHDNDDGISLIDSDNEKIQHNDSMNNVKYDGLFADSASTGNTFEGNKAFGNTEHDCHDDSVGTGTAGTANTWKGNKGNTQTPPGICKPQ